MNKRSSKEFLSHQHSAGEYKVDWQNRPANFKIASHHVVKVVPVWPLGEKRIYNDFKRTPNK